MDRGAGAFIIRSLVQALIMQSHYEEAEKVLHPYEEADPGDGRIPLLRGDILDRQNQPDAALAEYQKAIDLDPIRTGPVAKARIDRVRARQRQH